jgi:DNA-binding MarR family transcriptional regulator
MFLSNRLVEFALQTLSSRIVSYIENNGPISNLQETAFILGVTRPSLSRAVSQLVSQGTLRKTTDGYVLT